jgi:hypothetical protein
MPQAMAVLQPGSHVENCKPVTEAHWVPPPLLPVHIAA